VIHSVGWLRPFAASFVALGLLGLLSACSAPESEPARPPVPAAKPSASPVPAAAPAAAAAAPAPAQTPEQLYERGRSIYAANCTACHGIDPTKPGGLGPEIAGSSRELIEARVLHAAYPPGYSPKRDTKLMVALPHLKNELDALAVYLEQAAKRS